MDLADFNVAPLSQMPRKVYVEMEDGSYIEGLVVSTALTNDVRYGEWIAELQIKLMRPEPTRALSLRVLPQEVIKGLNKKSELNKESEEADYQNPTIGRFANLELDKDSSK